MFSFENGVVLPLGLATDAKQHTVSESVNNFFHLTIYVDFKYC